jgi:NAD(P)H-hydrate repair Nnr-like enzyme with NAD(P)H-hydrate epimerase domain
VQYYLQLMWSSLGVGVRGCRLIREEVKSYIHHYKRCVHVIPVLSCELPSGGMVGVTQYHCYTKLHHLS